MVLNPFFFAFLAGVLKAFSLGIKRASGEEAEEQELRAESGQRQARGEGSRRGEGRQQRREAKGLQSGEPRGQARRRGGAGLGKSKYW